MYDEPELSSIKSTVGLEVDGLEWAEGVASAIPSECEYPSGFSVFDAWMVVNVATAASLRIGIVCILDYGCLKTSI